MLVLARPVSRRYCHYLVNLLLRQPASESESACELACTRQRLGRTAAIGRLELQRGTRMELLELSL